MSAALLLLLIAAPAQPPVDTIVVCPLEFRAALAPWVAHRESQGHRLALLAPPGSSTELRAQVRKLAAAGRVRYLVIAGDARPPLGGNRTPNARLVPTHYARAVVNVRWGSQPQIATDNWYADLDDDRVPELAVGRLTADTPAELARMVEKILAYETCADFGHWRRQVHFVAGLGGFGPVADAVLEAAAKTLITSGIPAAYSTTMTYGSWQSPYCPDPRQFERVTLDRLNEGSLFWVYIGHGQQRSVDVVRVPGGTYPIFSTPDAARLECRHGAPIACLLACYSGAFDQPHDCLAEEMLRSPGGPVAILCGSRVTMPYGMAVLGAELLAECFGRRPATIGELIVAAKRRTMDPSSDSPHRATLDGVAKAFSSLTGGDLEAERAEHLDLFALLGDPLLRLPYPREIDLEVKPTAAAGSRIEVAGNSPIAGACTLELVVRRDRLTFEPPRRGEFDPRLLAEYGDVYKRANEPRLAATKIRTLGGRFRGQLEAPAAARGACHVRVFVEGAGGCAAGAADVRLHAPDEPE
jgi:hypothetical protein